jgi:hypothetical protein
MHKLQQKFSQQSGVSVREEDAKTLRATHGPLSLHTHTKDKITVLNSRRENKLSVIGE